MRVLLELRPALDGHAGIPQETRLLFRELLALEGVQAEGLIQSSNRVLPRGLPPSDAVRKRLSGSVRIDRLSRVVASLQQAGKLGRFEQLSALLKLLLKPAWMVLTTLLGFKQTLTVFDPRPFKDFVWRAFFEKTVSHESFELLTGAKFRVLPVPWSAMHAWALVSGRLTFFDVYPRLNTREFDLMIAETPYPGRVCGATKLIVRYHDAIPLLMPHTISDRAYHRATHYHALRRNVRDKAWFACVSDATRNDLVAIFPEVAERAFTVHNIVSDTYFPDTRNRASLHEIINTRRMRLPKAFACDWPKARPDLQYLLMVSTIEPRKNHLTLLGAWEQLRSGRFPGLQLVFVGSLGWEHKPILRKLRPWLANGGLHLIEDVPTSELRLLYTHAAATVCPSYGEGFDFSGVEAMRCGSVIVASDIPVHREIFGTASRYCTPYSQDLMAAAIEALIDPAAADERDRLRLVGQEVALRYSLESVLPQWQRFLTHVAAA